MSRAEAAQGPPPPPAGRQRRPATLRPVAGANPRRAGCPRSRPGRLRFSARRTQVSARAGPIKGSRFSAVAAGTGLGPCPACHARSRSQRGARSGHRRLHPRPGRGGRHRSVRGVGRPVRGGRATPGARDRGSADGWGRANAGALRAHPEVEQRQPGCGGTELDLLRAGEARPSGIPGAGRGARAPDQRGLPTRLSGAGVDPVVSGRGDDRGARAGRRA